MKPDMLWERLFLNMCETSYCALASDVLYFFRNQYNLDYAGNLVPVGDTLTDQKENPKEINKQKQPTGARNKLPRSTECNRPNTKFNKS